MRRVTRSLQGPRRARDAARGLELLEDTRCFGLWDGQQLRDQISGGIDVSRQPYEQSEHGVMNGCERIAHGRPRSTAPGRTAPTVNPRPREVLLTSSLARADLHLHVAIGPIDRAAAGHRVTSLTHANLHVLALSLSLPRFRLSAGKIGTVRDASEPSSLIPHGTEHPAATAAAKQMSSRHMIAGYQCPPDASRRASAGSGHRGGGGSCAHGTTRHSHLIVRDRILPICQVALTRRHPVA